MTDSVSTSEEEAEREALQAYSDGKIGWREACKRLFLLDIRELGEALAEAGLPQPSENETDGGAVERFGEFLTNKGESADE